MGIAMFRNVANVVENIIETGCQAVGGLFQAVSGYDPEEGVFIRAMKKKPKRRKEEFRHMADESHGPTDAPNQVPDCRIACIRL